MHDFTGNTFRLFSLGASDADGELVFPRAVVYICPSLKGE